MSWQFGVIQGGWQGSRMRSAYAADFTLGVIAMFAVYTILGVLIVLAILFLLCRIRSINYWKMNHEAIGAIAATVQAIAVLVAGLWIAVVFWYSEKIKPSLPETFLNPQLRLAIAGSETEKSGAQYFVVRLEMEIENQSGQKIELPSSIVIVNADTISSETVEFKASNVEQSLNRGRGSRGRYRGKAEVTEVVYVGNEYSRWSMGIGERVLHSRLFRVPVGKFHQLEANWYTLAGPNIRDVEIAHVVVDDPKNHEFAVISCACKGDCPRPPTLSGPTPDRQECVPPWYDFDSEGARRLFGFGNKSGMSTATAFLVLPPKAPAESSVERSFGGSTPAKAKR